MSFILTTLAVMTMACWFFLLHGVLESINASELQWFIYWTYLITALALQIGINLIRGK